MKNIFLTLVLFSIVSCSDEPLKFINQEIIDGKVSATEKGHIGRITTLPKIYVQTDKTTRCVEIPFKYEKRWKVGDSCLLIIKRFKVIEK